MSATTVSGNVVDQNGIALQNAKLTLTPVVSTLAPAQFTYSDASGNYSFTITTNGTYQLTVTSNGIVYPHPKKVVALGSAIVNLNFQGVAQNANNSGSNPYKSINGLELAMLNRFQMTANGH